MQRATHPVILEAAINGITSRDRNPAVPVTPAQVADDALACLDAGAAVVHTHIDKYFVPPDECAARYLEAYEAIVGPRPDAVLYPTIGQGETIAERYGHHDVLAERGVIRCGLLDPGSVNLGAIGSDGLPVGLDFVYVNSPSDIRYEIEACRRLELGPSVAVFEPGFLRVIAACRRAGALPRGTLVKLYFSEAGYIAEGEPMYGPPPIPEALTMYLAMLEGLELPWAIAVLGGSVLDSPILEPALRAGGHLRVGLEDQPDASSNLAEVERARELCHRLGRPLASCAEAAALLDLPR
jgi:uncharacterized protein (DUF849 family)